MEAIALVLKALGHPDRLRILALLGRGELTVSELVQIMGLSQPRVTQYIQSLEAAGIVERLKEGSWVFSRLRRGADEITALIAAALDSLPEDDAVLKADLARLDDVRAARAKLADAFFARVANDGGQLGDEYLPQSDIEIAMRDITGAGPFGFMVDLGTGTGRTLDVFADRIERGTGIDANTDMLKLARHRLAQAGHEHVSVRHGDLHATPLTASCADLVTLHQVLHYLEDPIEAFREVGRLLKPGGTLLIVDYAAHDVEAFREAFAHRRLGFQDDIISDWMDAAGITLATVKTVSAGSDRPDVKLWLGEANPAAKRRAQ